MATPTPTDFTNEAATDIVFPSDREFAAYRDEVRAHYDGRMVRVERAAVYRDGRVRATVHHSRNLGTELKGLAFAYHHGRTVRTIFERGEN